MAAPIKITLGDALIAATVTAIVGAVLYAFFATAHNLAQPRTGDDLPEQ